MDKIMNEVCVFLADGFEEIEGLTVVDLLRRAGIETRTVSIMGQYRFFRGEDAGASGGDAGNNPFKRTQRS